MNQVTHMRSARAFTVLEVVLASVLGLLVVITCAGIFAAIDRSHRRQEQRLDETVQFARAHQTIERALQNIVMVDARPPETELEDRLKEQARLLDEGRDIPLDPTSRFTLRPDPAVTGSLTFSRDVAVFNMNPQVFELAVRSSPVFGGEVQSPADLQARTVADRSSRRADRRERSDFTPATERSSRDLESGDAVDALSLGYNPEDEPRAPGVRGVFELRPDGEVPVATGVLPAGAAAQASPVRRASSGASGEQGWTLWWRELPHRDLPPPPPAGSAEGEGDRPPPADPAAPANAEGSRSDQSRANRAPEDFLLEAGDQALRRVLLVSGLKTCRWEAYRRDRRDTNFSASYEAELPSYVSLELVSLSGRRENWMFEIGWSDGPEPGAIYVAGGGGPGASTDLSGLAGGPAGGGAGTGGTGDTGGTGGPGVPGKPTTGGNGKPAPTGPGRPTPGVPNRPGTGGGGGGGKPTSPGTGAGGAGLGNNRPG